jgi:hypothetical protein
MFQMLDVVVGIITTQTGRSKTIMWIVRAVDFVE